ncbi:ABC transporter ATP-binding protein [Cellulomonas sp.]|uniref:ABC transporter ATP-binding protein n=1 Tax=Cellulomonas sp. TaxID=40001 RepID=UPI001B0D025B|nr:ABC transporter ATP-binding protein [Cellulomonas sp.]MBO9556697.1 ABC transporter ATP-binding protein [Cellulomonas sp.]
MSAVERPAIRVEHLSKSFALHTEKRNSLKERVVRGRGSRGGQFDALDDVSFDVPRGTTVGLVGHNGSGKSTLLKILAGVYRPTSGAVLVDGRVSALLELGAGFHGELTGRENIYLNGAILGLTKREVDAAIDQIIEFSGLGDFIDSPVKIYSSGMYVRLGFAIAVTVEPEILIVDEIIAVGDEEFQRKCFDHLFRLRNQGTTIVLVTHSMGLAAELCDSAVWLDHGVVRAIGAAPEVIDQYLAEVNRAEAANVPAAAGTPEVDTPEGVARTGSGEVRVSGVELLGADGAPVSVLLTGEPLTVRVSYEVHEPVSEVSIALGFVHENGVGIAGTNTRQHGPRVDLEPGRGYIDYVFDELPLLPANWRLSTAVRSRGHTYDHLDKAFPLAVRAQGEVENGAVRLRGTWHAPVHLGADATSDPVVSS